MTLLWFYLALALVVSFFCSISEAVLLSVRPAYVGALRSGADGGGRGAAALERLLANLDRPLAAILTLNTVAHTVGAAGVGAQAAKVFGDAYLGLTSGLLTLAILIFSEIIPKTLGAAHWKALAPTMGILILWLTRALAPFVWLTERITRLTSRTGTSAFTFSRDEIEAMAEIGAREGLLGDQERQVVSNLMRLEQLSVRDIMTPRTVMFSLPSRLTVSEFFKRYADEPFSRIPVHDAHPDDFHGYVLKLDLSMAQARDQFDRTLGEFRREFLAIPDATSASAAFDTLTRESSHLALVVDEYGSVQGLVTLEDVLETLIGLEITDESDTVEDMQVLARERWRQRIRKLGIDPDSLSDS